jgi:hypothetical protein
VSADSPDRPGVAALVAELEVRRHVRTAVAAGLAFALAVFLLFAYLPGTEESLLYWAALAFVLAFAVSGLVATVLLGYATYRRTLEVGGVDPGGPSGTTLAVVFGLLGWVLVPVAATLAFRQVSVGLGLVLGRTTGAGEPGGLSLLVAVVTGGFVVLAVGGLGLKFVTALSLSHEWRPREAAWAAVAYTALVAAPAVACPSGGPCLGTPDRLVVATVGLAFGAVSLAYAAVTLGGGLALGLVLGSRGAAPPHGFFAGCVAAASALPVVAAAAGDPVVVRTTALYLPVVLGTTAAAGSGVVLALEDRGERSSGSG